MNILTRPDPTDAILSPNTALTPNRKTSVTFDLNEVVTINGGTALRRSGHQIAPVSARDKGTDSRFSLNMRLWSPGAWSLRPMQDDFARIQEKGLPAGIANLCVFQPDGTGVPSGMACVGVLLTRLVSNAPASGTGLTLGASASSSGDPFYQKNVPAGGTFTQAVGASADVLALQPALEADLGTQLTYALDPVLSTDPQRANQGLCLRWFLPGSGLSTYDVAGAIHFGQYALVFYGNGDSAFWEYARPAGQTGGTYAWAKRKTFQYCRPNQVTGAHHAMTVFPITGPNGERMVTFTGTHLIASESGSGGVVTAPEATRSAGHTTQHETYHKWDSTIDGGFDESPGSVTKGAKFYVSWRRDIRAKFQLSRLIFQQTGILTDQPAFVGVQLGAARTYSVGMTKRIPSGGTLTAAVNDTVTKVSTGAITKPYAVFTFGGDGTDTPLLWDYTLSQPEATQTVTPGAFTAKITSCDLTGPDGDPRHERGSITINDPSDQESRLRNRGELSARVQTTYTPPGGSPTNVVLFRGYALRPHRRKLGTVGMAQGITSGAGSVARSYPSPEWSEYGVTLTGMWERLTEITSRTATAWQTFGRDETAADDPSIGGKPPWKVTDALRKMLSVAGFPGTMINIPDNPLRLFPGIGTGPDDLMINSSTNLAEQIMVLCRGYLFQFLYFDPNAGPLQDDTYPCGQWTLLHEPQDADPTVYNFITDPPATTSIRLLYGTAGLPANTALTIGHLESYIERPEANHLCVMTMDRSSRIGGGMLVAQHVFNTKSYNAPGFTNTVDHNSPHYMGGREKLLLKLDLSLWGGDGPDSLQRTQNAVDFITRRYYNFACRARRIQPLFASLAFVQDAVTSRYRPLRFYDKVTFNGQTGWYVRSASPRYTSDRIQTCDYELERIEP